MQGIARPFASLSFHHRVVCACVHVRVRVRLSWRLSLLKLILQKNYIRRGLLCVCFSQLLVLLSHHTFLSVSAYTKQ